MDPVSAAGIALSVTSLTFQVFSGCIKGYQLLADARGMHEEHRYLTLRLKAEQHRLLNWAETIQLADGDEKLRRNDKTFIHEILNEQGVLLQRFGRYERRGKIFEASQKPFLEEEEHSTTSPISPQGPHTFGEDEDVLDMHKRFPKRQTKLLSKCLEYVESTRKYPRRLKWAAMDADAFKVLLQKLTKLNDKIQELLTESELQTMSRLQVQTNYEIVQLNNKVDQLVQLFQACQISMLSKSTSETSLLLLEQSSQSSSNTSVPSFSKAVADLSRYKALLTSTEGETEDDYQNTAKKLDQLARASFLDQIEDPKKTEIERKFIKLGDITSDEDKREEAILSYDGQKKQHVWVEWNIFEPTVLDKAEANRKLTQRIQRLAALLKDRRKPSGFRAPDCLGYFKDDNEERVGFVFAKPPNVAETTKPLSLFTILEKHMAEKKKPSLTSRVALATAIVHCVEHLHSVNWLHKGLRSDNIVFFPGEKGEISYHEPYLAGFDYARPSPNPELTQKPNTEHDIYRHPKKQGGATTSFRKTFDLYALGVLLVEIAYWAPIYSILSIDKQRIAKPTETKKVHPLLTQLPNEGKDDEPTHLETIQSNMGDSFFTATKGCLRASEELLSKETRARDIDETAPETGEELQGSFYELVVLNLSRIVA